MYTNIHTYTRTHEGRYDRKIVLWDSDYSSPISNLLITLHWAENIYRWNVYYIIHAYYVYVLGWVRFCYRKIYKASYTACGFHIALQKKGWMGCIWTVYMLRNRFAPQASSVQNNEKLFGHANAMKIFDLSLNPYRCVHIIHNVL